MAQIHRRQRPLSLAFVGLLGACVTAAPSARGQTPGDAAPQSPLSISPPRPFSQLDPQPVTHQVSKPTERIEMIVNTSRILTQEQRIPQAQVNNPEIVGLTALSPNQVQIFAKKPGVTQVNIWDEKDQIHAVDVTVYGDVQELARLLQSQFPKAALRLTPIATGVVIQGYVDDPNVQSRIIEIAQNYYPNVINSITVGGVQQVLLQVRVLEVSRTKLQSLGIDLAVILENGSFFASGAAGLLRPAALTASGAASTTGSEILTGRIANNGDSFFGFVEALKRNNLAKILADPNLVTVSGRPAFMNSGGEIPILVPQSLGTVSIQYRRYGTQVDFVPIVLGNGVIRLEVRPRISELDDSRSVSINGSTVPAMLVREADTAAELRAGQTLAIAGLVQTRIDSSTRGVPGLMDVPYLGALFRRTSEQINEIELLIMVTPQLVEGLSPQDLCNLGPGLGSMTTMPGDCQLFAEGRIEVSPDQVRPPHMQQPFPIGAQGGAAMATPARMPGSAPEVLPPAVPSVIEEPSNPLPPTGTDGTSTPTELGRYRDASSGGAAYEAKVRPAARSRESSSTGTNSNPAAAVGPTMPGMIGSTDAAVVRPFPASPSTAPSASSTGSAQPGMIGPIGYDVDK